MTYKCLTYIASSAAFVSTFAHPLQNSQEDLSDMPSSWTAFYKTTPSMNHAAKQNDTPDNIDSNPEDVHYLDKIKNVTQDVLNYVQTTLPTLSDTPYRPLPMPNPPPPDPYLPPFDQRKLNSHERFDPFRPFDPHHPPPSLFKPRVSLTTPEYYDPYHGGGRTSSRGGNAVALGLGIGIPVGVLATVFLIGMCFWCRKRKRENKSAFPLPFTKKENDYEAQLDSPAYSLHDPWVLNRAFLEVDYSEKLGSGAFCNVFKGKINGEAPVSHIHPDVRTHKLSNCSVAVKMLPAFADDIARSDFMQEINFMKSLAYHPHLVSMLGYVADKKSPYLLVELCEKGDLLHLIRNRRNEIIQGPSLFPNGLKIKDLLMFSWQISNGLEYLNSLGCIHRDIAARNVLVDISNTCKIGDFGLCRLTDSLLYTARGGRLPLKWLAPESLSNYEYSFKSDIWSYGVLLWELFSLGEVPYAEVQTTELLATHRSGKRLPQPDYCPKEIYDVMLSTWKLQPEERPSFTQICTTLGRMLEKATENYGYLLPLSKHESTPIRDNNEEESDDV